MNCDYSTVRHCSPSQCQSQAWENKRETLIIELTDLEYVSAVNRGYTSAMHAIDTSIIHRHTNFGICYSLSLRILVETLLIRRHRTASSVLSYYTLHLVTEAETWRRVWGGRISFFADQDF